MNAMGIRPHVFLLHVYQIILQNPIVLTDILELKQLKGKKGYNALLTYDQILVRAICIGHGLLK